MPQRREKLRTKTAFLSETRSPHSSRRCAPSSNHRSTSRISKKWLPDAKNYARKRHSSRRREVLIHPGASRPHQIIGRLRAYKRNGLYTRKCSHDKAISIRGAKSSSIRALRALIKSWADFARISETTYRREKVRTREPFLPETRSPHSHVCEVNSLPFFSAREWCRNGGLESCQVLF